MHEYWQKQGDEPLYPDILWSRPESKAGAGKLAVIGGHAHGFGAPGIAWNTALESGAGVVNVLLPGAIKKTVSHVLPDAEYAPSNPSGSFSKKALDDWLRISSWSDLAMLSGDMGRNSETAVLLETYLEKYPGLLTITQDAIDYVKESPHTALKRENTLLVMSLSQLQRLFINAPSITAITYSMSTVQLVEALHEFTSNCTATIITKHNDLLFIASHGNVVTQKLEDQVWRVAVAARASVFWMQNPGKPFEASVASVYEDSK